MDCHRWRNLVDGSVKKVVIVLGTYYAAFYPTMEWSNALKPGMEWSTLVIYFEADNEVSTCEVTVEGTANQRRLRYSSWDVPFCWVVIVFGPQASVSFTDDIVPENFDLGLGPTCIFYLCRKPAAIAYHCYNRHKYKSVLSERINEALMKSPPFPQNG